MFSSIPITQQEEGDKIMADIETVGRVQDEVGKIKEETGSQPEDVKYQPHAWTREGRSD